MRFLYILSVVCIGIYLLSSTDPVPHQRLVGTYGLAKKDIGYISAFLQLGETRFRYLHVGCEGKTIAGGSYYLQEDTIRFQFDHCQLFQVERDTSNLTESDSVLVRFQAFEVVDGSELSKPSDSHFVIPALKIGCTADSTGSCMLSIPHFTDILIIEAFHSGYPDQRMEVSLLRKDHEVTLTTYFSEVQFFEEDLDLYFIKQGKYLQEFHNGADSFRFHPIRKDKFEAVWSILEGHPDFCPFTMD